MNPVVVSLIVFACVFGGAIFGALVRGSLPEHHLSPSSSDAVKVGMGLVVTMSALVLGLLISSAKGFFDTQTAELTEISAKVIFLDRILARYGPETKDSRDMLRTAVLASIEKIWPQEQNGPTQMTPPTTATESLVDKIQALLPKNEKQQSLKAEALSVAFSLGQSRWLMYEQGSSTVSKPVLVIVIFWLTAIFISFGLFAPRNATVTTALLFSGLSVSGAIFLILELYSPFQGLLKVDSAPLRFALAHLGQ